ncbi:uncharacterized protein C5orf47 homolog [Globicephala melas]|uniref:uncharacterized protein C5orf47 homolog n=1 Tax=Globicephala melas TaxID=9731 RepID=UPI00293D5079|nr:uncharacterized protein C5orf47 homolog [Globicephala melas]
MTAAGREQERDRTRFVYVTRFGSHQCGAVLQLGGRRAQGLCRPGLGAGRSREEPQAAVPGAAGGGELCPGSPPRAPAASSPARASSSRSRPRQEAHAGGAKGRAGGRGLGRGPPACGGCRLVSPPFRPPRQPSCLGSESQGGRLLSSRPPCQLPVSLPPGLTQKNLAKKFDFPIPLNEASKIVKKKKKVSVWNGVYKVISKMLEENEKYRLRLKLCSENSNYTK